MERKSLTKRKRAKKSHRKTSSQHLSLPAKALEITRLRQTRVRASLIVRAKKLIPRTKMNSQVMRTAVKRAVNLS